MTKVVVSGVLVVLAVQIAAFVLLDRSLVGPAAGIALAVVVLAALRVVARRPDHGVSVPTPEAAVQLQRWSARTETLICWAESSRADWDRRLRPMLARQYALAAGQRKSRDARAFEATGRMLFGEQLWQWVDPDNISVTGSTEPGPGRAVLDEILQRLERV
jgi:hypothetical protein